MFSHVHFKRHLSHRLESSPSELNKIQNSIGGDSVHIIQCQLVSVGVRWTSVGLSAAVRLFLVDFDCWFGNIPADSPAGKSVGLTSPASMHWKVTGKSPDNYSSSRAKNSAFWIGQVRRSPPGVRPENKGECKDLHFQLKDASG